MKLMHTLLFLLLLVNGRAQNCDYVKERFGVRSVKKVFVGIEPDFQGKPDSLFLDIYYPVGATEAKRPLVMWIFGGGFITGKREDFASVCEGCARRGFVAATIDYRIGFNGTSILPFDSSEVIRAGFRGAQDAKCAMRYLKSRHVEDSIDLQRVWAGGGSAGAIVALAAAFYDKDSEKPAQAGNIGPANGNPRNDLGTIDGSRYLNGYDTKVQGIFNIFGAVLDLNIVDTKDNIAVFSYHQTEDPVVPCGHRKAYWGYPVVNGFYPYAFGSCEIEPHLAALGQSSDYHKAWIYPGNQHATHNEAEVINFMLSNANPILCGTVGVKDNVSGELDQVALLPNPAGNEIYMSGLERETDYWITDLSGVMRINGKTSSSVSIDLSGLADGMYLVNLRQGNLHRAIKLVKSAY